MFDLVPMEEYDKGFYDPAFTAIEKDNIAYPIRSKKDVRPGYYDYGLVAFFRPPVEEEDKKDYSLIDNEKLVDFTNVDNIQEAMAKASVSRNLEREILTTPDNIFIPVISDLDAPEMAALKEAVIAKNIDIDKYEPRFGSNFPNEKRAFKKHDITLLKLKRICNGIDIKMTLTLEDMSPNVPNPIGRVIYVNLNEGTDEDGV